MQFKQSLDHYTVITITEDVRPYYTYMWTQKCECNFLTVLFLSKTYTKLLLTDKKKQ